MPDTPDRQVSSKAVFGLEQDFQVPAFGEPTSYTPKIDPDYVFDPTTTTAILAGFAHDFRVLIQGRHGTGKSSHIEQVAARLNWACIRVNLDSHISRMDLIGKDAIVLKDGAQVTEFREGILPFAYQRPVALIFDEYDAGRPDVMFVIQRVLEAEGRLTLADQNRVIPPHPWFRMFATANTVGLGDASGLYQGVQQLNQAQLDRWTSIVRLDYLAEERETAILLAKSPWLAEDEAGRALALKMVRLADLTRAGFEAGDVSTVMSPRTLINWAANARVFGDTGFAFKSAFLNRCDAAETPIFYEYYQRAMGVALPDDPAPSWRPD